MTMFNPQDHEDILERWYRKDGYEYQLAGILYDKEDWWWMLTRGGRCNEHTQMLSCVCKIETYGFELIE